MTINLTPEETQEPSDGMPEVEVKLNVDGVSESVNLEPEGKEVKEVTPKEAIDYKERYAESTREAQRIMAENKTLQASVEETNTRLSKLETEKDELESTLKTEDPEKYDSLAVKRELSSIRKDLVTTKEENSLNDFLMENPTAKEQKSALRSLGRANPNQSYSDLWDTVVKPLQEAGVAAYQAKQGEKKESQTETGKGSQDESSGNLELQRFNKLPTEQKQKVIEKLMAGDKSFKI